MTPAGDAVGKNQPHSARREPLLAIGRIATHLGGAGALDQAALTLNAAKRLAPFGENGDGKSALIKLLAYVHALDSGRIVHRRGEASGSALGGRAGPSIENLLAAASTPTAPSLPA
jgi:ABC-type polysaccharide/polyol phosphate transport system ATPase subunit